MRIKSDSRGFTLIEAIVALAIIAIVLATTNRAMQNLISQTKELYVRQIASYIIENEYNNYRINQFFPDNGHNTKTVTMANQEYKVDTTISATLNPFFKKLDMNVSTTRDPHRILFSTTAFLSKY